MVEVLDRTDLDFSPRESEVWKLIAEGKTNQQISEILIPNVVVRTVEHHINLLFTKLNLTCSNDNPRVSAALLYWKKYGLPQ